MGVEKVIIHTRKAILESLSPKQNRTIQNQIFLSQINEEKFPKHGIISNCSIKDLGIAKSFIAGLRQV